MEGLLEGQGVGSVRTYTPKCASPLKPSRILDLLTHHW